MTSSDRFPVPVRSAVKSNLTDWCFQNLSKRALNAWDHGKLVVYVAHRHLNTIYILFLLRRRAVTALSTPPDTAQTIFRNIFEKTVVLFTLCIDLHLRRIFNRNTVETSNDSLG